MVQRVSGKVAMVTGAARGQGRSHALRLAEEGADVIALDLCAQIPSVPYPLATRAELEATVAAVRQLGRRAVAVEADVRDATRMAAALDGAVADLGRLDIVCANAGIVSYGTADSLDQVAWDDVIATNLTGVWNTVRAAWPHLRSTGAGASVVVIASTAAFHGLPGLPHYSAAKHGVVGLTRSLARDLGAHGVRVNAVCPGTVRTPMVENDNLYELRYPDGQRPEFAELAASLGTNPLGIDYIDVADISNAVLFLASDEARCITGVALPVDCGVLA